MKVDPSNTLLKKKAYGLITESLDILNIIREINTLKVLTQFLLRDHHQLAVPPVALNLRLAKMAEKGKPVATGCLNAALADDTGDIRAAIRLIKNRCGEPAKNEAIAHDLDRKLDLFFYDELNKNPLPTLADLDDDPNKHFELLSIKKESWGQLEADKSTRGLQNKPALTGDPTLQRSIEQIPFTIVQPNNVKPVSVKIKPKKDRREKD